MYVSGNELIHGQKQHNMVIRQHPAPKLNHCSRLKFKGLFSFDRYSKSWVKRHRTPTYYNPATGRDEEGNLLLSVGTDGQEFLDTENKGEWGNKATYLEGNITYDRTFDGKHAVNAMFLYNQRDYQDGNVVPFRRMGIAGRASYTYDNRYIAEFNFGYNGSENSRKGTALVSSPLWLSAICSQRKNSWRNTKILFLRSNSVLLGG